MKLQKRFAPPPNMLFVLFMCLFALRYGRQWERDYLQNLTTFFKSLRSVLPEEVLIVWTMAMPLSEKIIGGFLVPEVKKRPCRSSGRFRSHNVSHFC